MEYLQGAVIRGLRHRPTNTTSLQKFITQTPGRDRPKHLQQLTDLFQRIKDGKQVNALVTVPPQHGKSETCLHGLVWLMLHDPTRRHAYATYAQAFTRDQSQIANRIASLHALGLQRDTMDRWNTHEGGGVVWTSRGGPLTGHGIDGLLLVDDLLKDREEANSPLIRKKAMGWLSSVAFTRRHPGASTIIVATRWHLDDPIGQLLEASEGDWEYIKLPAINSEGEALWPEHRPLAWLETQRERLLRDDWSSLYMCEPVSEASRVFQGVTYYDELPVGPYREEVGFDAAYTSKTSADYSVAIVGRVYQGDDKLYITNLLREQNEPEMFVALLKAHGIRRVSWHRSGTEKGLETYLKSQGIRVNALPAVKDKLNRAIPLSTAWARGEVLLPRNATFTPIIEAEFSKFTGIGDAQDDIVDAANSLREALVRQKPLSREVRQALSPW